MKSLQQQRAEAKRAEKLAEIDEQVKSGSLVIRQMTKAEREADAKTAKPRPKAKTPPRRSR